MISMRTRQQHQRKASVQRKNLRIATMEGVPAVMFQTLLGGQFLTGYLLYLGASSSQLGFVLAITTFVNIAQLFAAFLIQRLKSRKWTLVLFVAFHRILWLDPLSVSRTVLGHGIYSALHARFHV